jgi:CPA2 family monovalent cation:H+ antiporter-2
VIIATQAGFSPALGAFVMGSLLAETDEGPRIEHVLHPLKDFFGAVFFVSVGMLFDPHLLLELWPQILGITFILIAGKTFAVALGATIAGQNMKTSIRAGLSMTQIGEFSFIIASLGLSLGVVSERLYPIAVGVSLLSSVLTPVWLKRADKIHDFIERALPPGFHLAIGRYQSAMQASQGTTASAGIIRAYGPLITINLVLILATTWVSRVLIFPRLEELLGVSSSTRVLGLILTLILCLPFFWGMALRKPGKKWRDQARKFPRVRWIEGALNVSRILFSLMLFLVVTAQYVSWRTLSGLTIMVFLMMGSLFYIYGGVIYRRLEKRFLGQLSKAEEAEPQPALLPWDTHLSEVTVAAESPAAGMSIERLGLQESFGVMIAAITRGQKRILAPRGADAVFPGDRLSVLGSDADVERLRRLMESREGDHIHEKPLKLQSIVLSQESPLCGRAIRDSGIRDLVEGLLVGLEREGYRQLNPSADLRLEAGDRLWIVGDPAKMAALNVRP